jgi:5-methylcytosine-specific restriction endonuclease McrA
MAHKNPEDKKAYMKAYYALNKERIIAYAKIRYASKGEEIKAKNREYGAIYRENEINKDRISSYQKSHYEAHKAEKAAYGKAYNLANRHIYRARDAKRYATKLHATPSWSNLEDISVFYAQCPKGSEVDHICPLKGKNVSGLHVLDNLQYLTTEENRRKGNRFTNGMYAAAA